MIRDPEGRQLARCLISRGRYILGQERKNEIVIDESSVSGRHARLTVVTDEEIFIEDLDSANGTRVGDAPVLGLTAIEPGMRVSLGLCTLDFQRSGLPAGIFRYLPEGFLRDSRYNIGEAIVEGSTSTIFSAYDTTLGRDVAIKVLRPESQVQPSHVLRFIREAQITSQLQHPGILTVYELGLNDRRQLYYTTRFVEGLSLAHVIEGLAQRSEEFVEQYRLPALISAFQKACDAVAYANGHGIIHAALRPESISVGSYGEVLVISWCYARILGVDPNGEELTRHVEAAPSDSTPPVSPYAAPEIAAEQWDAISARTDVYSLGAILYRLVCLHRPFTQEEDEELRIAIVGGQARNPAAFAKESYPHCPGGKFAGALMSIAMRAMSTQPENRFRDVREFQQAIADWQSGLAR